MVLGFFFLSGGERGFFFATMQLQYDGDMGIEEWDGKVGWTFGMDEFFVSPGRPLKILSHLA